MPARWLYKDTLGEIEKLTSALSIGSLTAQLLRQRGIQTPYDAKRFLTPQVGDLKHPMIYRDMSEACALVHGAISRNENIVVYGDYDVDGVTAASILYLCIRSLGGNCRVVIPDRFTEGYGLNLDRLKSEIRHGMDVLITVDHGVTATQELDFLKSKKIQCIVVDHHTPKGALPQDIYLIGPMNLKEGHSDEPLAACGLAFKMAWALKENLKEALPYVELAALGTVADLCPLVGDNRILVAEGLGAMNKNPRPGLRHLIAKAGLDAGEKPITSLDIAFGLAPRINAAGRMGTPENAFKLLTTTNETEAENLAKILDEENRMRMKTEKSIVTEAIRQVESTHHFARDRVIVVASDRWHEGVIGIVAARLTEKYHRPALVIAVKNSMGKGSARSVAGFNLFNALNNCDDLFEKFGGHAAACGFLIAEDRIRSLKDRLNEYAKEYVTRESMVRTIAIDALIDGSLMNKESFDEIRQMEPFGMQNPRPLFAVQNVMAAELIGWLSWDKADIKLPEQPADIAFTLSPGQTEGEEEKIHCRLVDIKPVLRR